MFTLITKVKGFCVKVLKNVVLMSNRVIVETNLGFLLQTKTRDDVNVPPFYKIILISLHKSIDTIGTNLLLMLLSS